MDTLQTQDKELTTEDLTAQELAFSRFVANGYSLTQAYKKAFPKSEHLKIETIRKNASQLSMKSNIALEVATVKKRQALLARQAEDRLEEVLTDGDINSKNNKVADVAMFMYEQANGKAVQKVQTEGKHVVVTYDLSGGQGGEVPQEVLDQLAD